jgi:hypothetical protein
VGTGLGTVLAVLQLGRIEAKCPLASLPETCCAAATAAGGGAATAAHQYRNLDLWLHEAEHKTAQCSVSSTMQGLPLLANQLLLYTLYCRLNCVITSTEGSQLAGQSSSRRSCTPFGAPLT